MKKTSHLIITLLIVLKPVTVMAQTKPSEGIRENIAGVYALINCKIIVSPEKTIKSGTIIIRNGLIIAVGENIKPPADAEIRDYKDKTVYPGFIESYYPASPKENDATSGKDKNDKPEVKKDDKKPLSHWSPFVHPELEAIDNFKPDEKAIDNLHTQGFTAALVVPDKGIFQGNSTLVRLGGKALNEEIIRSDVAQHLAFEQSGEGQGDYPDSFMGAIALIRQTFLDAKWYLEAGRAYSLNPGQTPPETNISLKAMQKLITHRQMLMFKVDNDLDLLRAVKITNEFCLHPLIRGSGYEYRQLKLIRGAGVPLILPVNFPDLLAVEDPQEALSVSLKDLQHWEAAPENPGKVYEAHIPFTFTAAGLDKPEKFLENIRQAVKRGLPETAALDALTRQPARLFGVDKQVGTVEAGKLADLVITDGDLFIGKTKIADVWVDGQRFQINKQASPGFMGKWQASLFLANGTRQVELEINNEEKPEGNLKNGEKKIKLNNLNFSGSRFSAFFEGKDLGLTGFVMLNGKVDKQKINGSLVLPDGTEGVFSATRTGNSAADKPATAEPVFKAVVPAIYLPGGTYSRKSMPLQPEYLLLKNATVWTAAAAGKMLQTDILINKGKIAKIGKNISVPAKALVIDCTGKHITPGLVDAHSHTGIYRGVNEDTQAVTAEVRIGDVIDSYDTNFYNELAGGLTVANLLHGSANPIGGQNSVVKLRWGGTPDDMKFKQAPPGIKFALGENVKQSNWGDNYTTRYPQTRLGVEQLIRDSFKAALDYQKEWQAYKALPKSEREKKIPPRKDLELDALLEVLSGKRLVHSHSYRQDEILMLMRIAEDFNFRIATLQHVLEGYKIADIIARHGAGASTFSDWWGYKFEVYDAIPYNGALMNQNGIVVSFNSDSDELARRLNTEAAKAVKYGGSSEAEAIKFVTINPARQLKIDKYVGSLEIGKDADFAIWSSNPLSDLTICEQTWIDGRKYFDRSDDQEIRKLTLKERNRLIQEYLTSKNKKDDEEKKEEKAKGDKKPETDKKPVQEQF